ncbi:S41 family peptidase [Pedobacter aquatilis]|uniref:S41 family peptidase n=1 Tax=Pedobacter aquatilis TaxID=351343 RepID=UPI00292D95FC|nr:S41 family peptidase [Pedobacter aquatilis]
MSKYFLFFIIVLLFGGNESPDTNGGFESVNQISLLPDGWSFQAPNYNNIKLDSGIKFDGKYSLSIENSINYNTPQEVGNYFYIEEGDTVGKDGGMIELRGYMKMDDVQNGYAGIWLKVDGVDGPPTLVDKKIAGTHDWAAYSTKLNYSKKLMKIAYGGIIDGVGKVWFDNFQLYKDGKPISRLRRMPPKKAELDTSFRDASWINNIKINANNVANLAIVGQVWGFLKYHHPYAGSGDVNWDGELFKILASALKCKNISELNNSLEAYIDSLPMVRKCDNCKMPTSSKVLMFPDYGDLFTGKILTKSLSDKLRYIQQNRGSKDNYWVKKESSIGVPLFVNEKSYDEMLFPDTGYRLLALFRYWSIINYFSPYRNITEYDWNQVLKNFIPQFIAAKDTKEYTLTTLRLIATIRDTHANISNYNPTLESIKGKYRIPFRADFVEDNLIVSGFRTDTLNIQEKVKIGDIIVSINGVKIDKLIKKYLPLTSASNYETQLRDLPWNYLMRTNEEELQFVLKRKGRAMKLTIQMLKGKSNYVNPEHKDERAYYLIDNKIGYVNAGKYQNSELPEMKKIFTKTKGIIIDLREYPSDFMPYTFVNYIKSSKSLFAKFSTVDYLNPGTIIITDSAYNGSGKAGDSYNGKVVVIVNSDTQSQGEFTAMALQSSPNVKVIGSQTAGADGDITAIVLPGGILTMISSRGIYYPDNSPTQGVGVKIDVFVKPTIKGVIDGKDELLEKAINILHTN